MTHVWLPNCNKLTFKKRWQPVSLYYLGYHKAVVSCFEHHLRICQSSTGQSPQAPRDCISGATQCILAVHGHGPAGCWGMPNPVLLHGQLGTTSLSTLCSKTGLEPEKRLQYKDNILHRKEEEKNSKRTKNGKEMIEGNTRKGVK